MAGTVAKKSTGYAKREKSDRPQCWWQWLLMYPALAIALMTAVPQWVDRAQAFLNGLNLAEWREKDDNVAFFARNADCTDTPFEWVEAPKDVRVDGTICPSGDIMLRIETPKIKNGFIKGILLDKLIKQTKTARLEGGFMEAYAAGAPEQAFGPERAGRGSEPRGAVTAQAQFAIVVCQKMLSDNRTLLRHVKVGAQCFDEKIDTFTGAVTERTSVPCRSTC